MKKLQTLEELTEGMNEFEKFMFFRQRADALDEVKKANNLLNEYGDIPYDKIRKRLRVSKKRWSDYLRGKMPLPWDFCWDYRVEFEEEIKEANHKKNIKGINKYFDDLRSYRGEKVAPTSTISSPVNPAK